MIEASERYGVTLMEAMKHTLTPNFLSVLKNIERVGKVRRYFSSYCQYSSRYDKFKEGIVLNAFDPKLSNGAIMDIGVYTIYPMVVLFGQPSSDLLPFFLLVSLRVQPPPAPTPGLASSQDALSRFLLCKYTNASPQLDWWG